MVLSSWISANSITLRAGIWLQPGHRSSASDPVATSLSGIFQGYPLQESDCVAFSGYCNQDSIEECAALVATVLVFLKSEHTATRIATALKHMPNVYCIAGNPHTVEWVQLPDFVFFFEANQAEHSPLKKQLKKATVYSQNDTVVALMQNSFIESKTATGLKNELLTGLHASVNTSACFQRKIQSKSGELLGTISSNGRRPQFATFTNIVKLSNGRLQVDKILRCERPNVTVGPLTLVRCSSMWIDTPSLQSRLIEALYEANSDTPLTETFAPCQQWLQFLNDNANHESGHPLLDGNWLDAIWGNCYLVDGECHLVDQEWIWHTAIPVSVLFIRAAYVFLSRQPASLRRSLKRHGSHKRIITAIAKSLNLALTEKDFQDFIELEAQFNATVLATSVNRCRFTLRLRLWSERAYNISRQLSALLRRDTLSSQDRLP